MQIQNNLEGQVIVLISANAEWRCVLNYYQEAVLQQSPVGTYFHTLLADKEVIFFHGGWGKISAAVTTQYAIDRWNPELILNLGTCGGLADQVKVGDVILAQETLVYDIVERMGDPREAINHYCTKLDLSFLNDPLPHPILKSLLISADQDIDPEQVKKLIEVYRAPAADWESGAIAWTAQKNGLHTLILRGVSDLVFPSGGEIYESSEFHNRAEQVMIPLLQELPDWIRCAS